MDKWRGACQYRKPGSWVLTEKPRQPDPLNFKSLKGFKKDPATVSDISPDPNLIGLAELLSKFLPRVLVAEVQP